MASTGNSGKARDGSGAADQGAGLSDVLGQLAAAAGLELDPVVARRALREARAAGGQADDPELLEAAGASLGLRVVTVVRSLREFRSGGFDGQVALAAQGARGWVVVFGRRGRRFRVCELGGAPGEGEWLSLDELARRLGGGDLATPRMWFGATPATPLETIAAEEDDHAHGPSPVARLFALLRLDRDDLGVVVVYALAVGILSLATPIAVQALVGSVAFGALLQPVVVLTILVLAVLGFAAVLRGLQVRVVEVLQQRLFVRVASDLAHRLPRVRAEALDRVYGPELVNRFFDVLTVQKTAATFLLDGIGLLLQAAIGLLVLGFYHPALLAFDALLIVAVAVILVPFGRGAPATSVEESKAKYAVAAWLEEVARHPYVFRAGPGASHAVERAEELIRRYLGARRAHFGILIRQVHGLLWLQAIASAGLLGLGGALVVARQLTLGQLVAAELIVTAVVASLVKLGKHLESFYDLVAALDKLGHLADLPLENLGSGAAFAADERGARLEVTEATVAYHEGEAGGAPVSLSLEPGARALVTGSSGTGKTGLAELAFGLRLPASGVVSVDGVDTREAELATLRGRAALVGLVPEIFDGTIAENVAGGRGEVGPREVAVALRAVGLDEVVRRLPRGVATPLAASGAPLSLGQARRLAIARAIASRPRLIVLDDALAGLDESSRRVVESALFEPAAPWTLLAFAGPEDPLRARPGIELVLDLDAQPSSQTQEVRS